MKKINLLIMGSCHFLMRSQSPGEGFPLKFSKGVCHSKFKLSQFRAANLSLLFVNAPSGQSLWSLDQTQNIWIFVHYFSRCLIEWGRLIQKVVPIRIFNSLSPALLPVGLNVQSMSFPDESLWSVYFRFSKNWDFNLLHVVSWAGI